MAMKIGDVAVAFGVTPQTIRNWVKQDEMAEFFSPQARRDAGNSQAEFLANDLEVCNSIQVLLKQKANWNTIKENLRAGWRDVEMPNRLMVVDEEHESASSLQLMTTLAVVNERNEGKDAAIEKYEETISELKAEIKVHVDRIEKLTSTIMTLQSSKAAAEARAESAQEIIRRERELGRLEREIEMIKEGYQLPKGQG